MTDRWATALHEASHCCVAIALGGTCTGLAIFPDGHGLATLSNLPPFDLAVSQAAAAEAEKLADSHEPPEPEPERDRSETCDIPSTAAMAALAARFPLEAGKSDEREIAEFCIAGIEDEPERWIGRFNLVHEVARRVVNDHRDSILAVARKLHMQSVLSGRDIKEILKP